MRWPWQRRPEPPPPTTTIPNPRPDLWTDTEWARAMERETERERRDWERIMEPALRQFEAAERAVCDEMGLPAPPPLPRPRWEGDDGR
jgi:hypothetical protein